MWRRRKAQERTILTKDEAFTFGKLVILATKCVIPEPRTICLIGGQALDVIDPIGRGSRTLVGSEVANQIRAAARDRFAPAAGILLKILYFERVDFVSDEACEHRVSPPGW